MSDILTTILYDNEIAKTTDFQNIANQSVLNLDVLVEKILGPFTKKVILEGLTVEELSTPSMNVQVALGSAYDPDQETFLVQSDTSDSIALEDADSSSDRIDILECQRTTSEYDTQQRAFMSPVDSSITYEDVTTKKKYTITYQIVTGTAGSGVAPSVDSGWIKLAEINVGAGVTEITDDDIINCSADYDGGTNTDWTTDTTATFSLTSFSSFLSILVSTGWKDVLETTLGTNWASILATAMGTNWTTALETALGTNWTTALAATLASGWTTLLAATVGTNWSTAIHAALGSNWTTALATALGTNWASILATAMGTNWTTALETALGSGWAAELASTFDLVSQDDLDSAFPGSILVTDDVTLTKNALHIVEGDETLPLLTLPTSPSVGDSLEIVARSNAEVKQSLSTQTISYKGALYTTKGTTGKLLLKAGDSLKLVYRGTGKYPSTPTYNSGLSVSVGVSAGTGTISWSPNGRYLAFPTSSGNGYVYIYDFSTSSYLTLPETLSADGVLAWSPDSNYLFLGFYSSSVYSRVYKITDGTVTVAWTNTSTTNASSAVAWSPSGKYVAVGSSSSYTYVYTASSTGTLTLLQTISSGNVRIHSIKFSEDENYLIIGTTTSTQYIGIYLLVDSAFTLIAETTDHSPYGIDIKDNLIAYSSSSDPYLFLSKLNNETLTSLTQTWSSLAGRSYCPTFSPNGRYLVMGCSVSPYFYIFSMLTGYPTLLSTSGTSPSNLVFATAWSPDSSRFALATQSAIYIYTVKTSVTAEWEAVRFDTDNPISNYRSNNVKSRFF